jgi:hypothetical protein
MDANQIYRDVGKTFASTVTSKDAAKKKNILS